MVEQGSKSGKNVPNLPRRKYKVRSIFRRTCNIHRPEKPSDFALAQTGDIDVSRGFMFEVDGGDVVAVQSADEPREVYGLNQYPLLWRLEYTRMRHTDMSIL